MSGAGAQGGGAGNQPLFKLDLSGMRNFVKFRKTWDLSKDWDITFGLDYNTRTHRRIPRVELTKTLGEKKDLKLQINESSVLLAQRICVDKGKFGLKMDAGAGITRHGTPHVLVDLQEVRPAWAVAVAAASLVLLGKELGVQREKQVFKSGTTDADVAASLQRKGYGLTLNIRELSAIIKL
ncbi:unnamed protein product [Pedinophyceae sp. YPF-701]|nr:unnamed protein product [Pedinophyceae sp. YPF-701]